MIQRLSCSAKEYYKHLRGFVFPSLCAVCGETCDTKVFCPACWDLCAPPDPSEKCPHCFSDSEGLCRPCKRKPEHPFAKAYLFEDTEVSQFFIKHYEEDLFAFGLFQFGRLAWENPDVIVATPGSWFFAQAFSEKLGIFLATNLDALDFGQVILVLDVGGIKEEQEKLIFSLAECLPKRGYLLSLVT